jgi:hypothetical protein
MDGVFAVPATELFKNIPWGEGSMTHRELEAWIERKRVKYDSFYSSDYSSFDVSQPAWLLEDVFFHVIRPLFGELSKDDERAFETMVYSYIHKEIHTFDGTMEVVGCQLSGSLWTYMVNTCVNQVIDNTVLLMQGLSLKDFESKKCGDDNLAFFNARTGWDKNTHCKLIKKYFGIETKIGDHDAGRVKEQDPTFLSRTWTWNGAERDIKEVLWNLSYPERFRDYSPEKTGVSVERAEALVLLCSCLEQPATMRRYFDVPSIFRAAGVRQRDGDVHTYKVLAKMGSGFRTPWINFKFGTLKQNVVA